MDKAERARLVLMVKNRLLVRWLPDKPGGLKGLIELAADAAIDAFDVVTDNLGPVATDSVPAIETTDSASLGETESVSDFDTNACDCDAKEGDSHIEDCPQFASKPEPGRSASARDTLARMPVINDPAITEAMKSLEPEYDPGRYLCPQCAVTHQRSSGVGTRHAHLFYGGQPEVVHLEHCPVLKDAEAVCNCNAVVPSAAQRATDRREP